MSDESEHAESHLVVDPEELSPAALEGLVQEFVSREGTDYGHVVRTLEEKVADVMRQLEKGEARIVFDLASETTHIVPSRELPAGPRRAGREGAGPPPRAQAAPALAACRPARRPE